MNKYICLMLFIFLLTQYSMASIKFEKIDNRLIISSQNCSELSTTIRAITDYSRKIQEITLEQNIDLKEGYICQADVTALFPSFIRDQLLARRGPICYSLPLFFGKIIPRPFAVFDREFDFWLNSPLCRKLTPYEDLESGDIGVIGFSSDIKDHAYTYMTKDFSIQTDAAHYWHATSLKQIFSDYNVDTNCTTRFASQPTLCNKKNQDDRFSFYRCHSLENSIYKDLFSYVPNSAIIIEQKLATIEYALETRTLSLRKKEINLILNDASTQRDLFFLNQNKNSQELDRQYWSYLTYRIERIRMLTIWTS